VTVPNRIKKEDEEVGFDLAIHGEVAYPAEVTNCFHWTLYSSINAHFSYIGLWFILNLEK
jgi:hypothetical protein